jgi:chromosome segregation protein
MQDVIFAGSAQKSPMGTAEVTLSFDNAARVFPVDYDEVTFSRKLFRSGESEYSINGNTCRLIDMHELLAHTNMGRDMYSIVGQGRLDSILNSRPDERRVLIEEAAGLAKYKRRKEKALRKLAATERNLVRVRDILAEIKRQLKPLEIQARTANQHKGLVDTLRRAETEYIVSELNGLNEKRDALRKQTASVGKRLQELEKALESGRQKGDELEAAAKLESDALDRIKERRFTLLNNAEKVRGRIGLLREKEANLRLVGERFVDEAAGLAGELANVTKERISAETAAKKAEADLSAAESSKRRTESPEKLTAQLAQEGRNKGILAARLETEEAAAARSESGAGPVEQAARPKGITGVARDMIEIKPGYEAAVEAAAGTVMAALVSKDAASAKKITSSKERWQALLIAPLMEQTTAAKQKPKGLIPMTDVVTSKGMDERVYTALFGNCYIGKTWDDIWKLSEDPVLKKAVFVTMDGHRLAGGVARPKQADADDTAGRRRRIADLTEALAAAGKKEAAAQAALLEAEKETAERQTALAPLRRAVEESSVTLRVLIERENSLKGRAKAAGASAPAKAGDKLDAGAMKAQADRAEELRNSLTRLLAVIEKLANQAAAAAQSGAESEAKKRGELIAVRTQVTELEKQLAIAERDAHKEEISEAQLEPQIKTFEEQLATEFGLSYAEAKKDNPIVRQRDELLAVMRDTRSKIEYIGPINPIAAEEFDEVQERQEHLETQTRDLKRSERSLHKVIGLMDNQMSNKFLAIFEKVDAAFQDVFKNMFPDGKAKLILTDPGDLLTTGIEIEAQPSGRRLKKVSLLSGGESAMTALALLFGLFQINPAPFYILDEADVALDDVNLQRFVALIRKFKGQSQFLIVTHQRRTMEVADILYGVTMQRDGVSKVVSQRLEEASKA